MIDVQTAAMNALQAFNGHIALFCQHPALEDLHPRSLREGPKHTVYTLARIRRSLKNYTAHMFGCCVHPRLHRDHLTQVNISSIELSHTAQPISPSVLIPGHMLRP